MAKLPKLTLGNNEKTNKWDLTNDKTNKVVKTFATKAKVTTGAVPCVKPSVPKADQ